MNHNNSLHIDEALQRLIERLAQSTGLSPQEVIREAVSEYSDSHNGDSEPSHAVGSLFDRATAAGLIGSGNGLPSDLSTNPSHMEGFGRAGN